MKERNLRDYFGIVLSGFAMGICEIIPGVSGGTMAFILGIYEELIQSIRDVTEPEALQAALRLRIAKLFELLNWQFLLALFVGMMLAILSLSKLLKWLLLNQPALIWSFFFGLVFASIFIVSRRVSSWTPLLATLFGVCTILAFVLVGLVPHETPTHPLFLIMSGAIAICAMILPGISGAFILVLLGKYDYVLHAVDSFDLAPIFFVGVGAVIGLISFARVVGWLFERYPNGMVAALAGLMLGSLRRIWPFKEAVEEASSSALYVNVMPAFGANSGVVVGALLCALLGVAAVLMIERIGSRRQLSHGRAIGGQPSATA